MELNEAAAEVIEDTAGDVADVVRSLTKVKVVYTALGFALGAAAGSFFAYRIAYTKAELKYEKIAQDEIVELREHFRERFAAREAKPDLGDLAKKVEKTGYSVPNVADVEEKQEIEPPPEEEDEELDPNVYNVFKETKNYRDDWNYEAELPTRSPERPYIIHLDERHERDYSLATLTYFEGDDVLCDEDDEVLEDKNGVVGEDNLGKFGHGSGDPEVVFVRNDRLQVDFEIFRSRDTYLHTVQGIEHSDYTFEKDRRVDRRFDDE